MSKEKSEEIIERIVKNEIYCCVSGVVARVVELEPDQWCDSEGICGKPDDEEGYQDSYREPLEYWSVSNWFAEKLEAEGCLVERDFYGLNVWGRETSGQSITLDGCMDDIASRMLANE
jgi:hypothetical protein